MSQKCQRTVLKAVRMTPQEWKVIAQNAKDRGIAASTYMREFALTGKPPKSRSRKKITHEMVREMRRVGVNLNQLTKAANSNDQLNEAELKEVLSQLVNAMELVLE